MYPNITKLLETIGSNSPVVVTAKHLIGFVTRDNFQHISFPTLKSDFGIKELILMMDNRVVLKMDNIVGMIVDNFNNKTLFNNVNYHNYLVENNYELCMRLICHPHQYLPTKTFSLILGFENVNDDKAPFLDVALFKLDGNQEVLNFAVNAYLASDGFPTTCDLFLDNDFDEVCDKYKTIDFHSVLTGNEKNKRPSWYDYQEAIYQLFTPYIQDNENYPISDLVDKLYGFDVHNEKRNTHAPTYDLLDGNKVRWHFKQSLRSYDVFHNFCEALEDGVITVDNINVHKGDNVLEAVTVSFDLIPDKDFLTQKCISALTKPTFWDELTDDEKSKYEYLFVPKPVTVVVTISLPSMGKDGYNPYLSKNAIAYRLFDTSHLSPYANGVEYLFLGSTLWNTKNPIAKSYQDDVKADSCECEQDIMDVKRLMILYGNKVIAKQLHLYGIIKELANITDSDFGTSDKPQVFIEVDGCRVHYVNFKPSLLKLERCDFLNNDDIEYAVLQLPCNNGTFFQKEIYVKLKQPSDKMKNTVHLLNSLFI